MDNFAGQHWDAIATFFLGGGASKLLDTAYRWWRGVRQTRVEQVFDVVGDMYFAMRRCRDETDADYVLVIKVHNGGKDLEVGSPTFVTIVHEIIGEGGASVKERWQERPVDEHYSETIKVLLRERRIVTSTAEIQDGTLMKGAYTHAGVRHADTRLISASRSGIHLVVVAFARDIDLDNALTRESVDTLEGALQSLRRRVTA